MEHLETQVSDLRSFLPGALPSAASTPTSNAAHMAGVGVVAGVGPGAATAATAPRHPSQSAGSSVSAVGSNSAHPSPLAFGPNHNAQPARNHGSAVSTPGPVSAHRAATNGGGGAAAGGAAAAAGAKRKLNDTASGDDSSQRQQRSKRNRVSTSQILEGASGLLTVASVAVYSTSPLLGMSRLWKPDLRSSRPSSPARRTRGRACGRQPALPIPFGVWVLWRRGDRRLHQTNIYFLTAATSARGARSSAMAKLRVNAVATSTSPASMPQTAAPTISRTRKSSGT